MILPRSDWTHRQPPRRLDPRREPVRYLVVHHSEAPRDQSIEAIRRYHVETHGWLDIGYHYVIRRGQIFLARPAWAVGSHSPPVNACSLGILVTGDYQEELPEEEDQRALLQLLATLLGRYPEAEVVGHGEVQADRACPGRLLEGIRERLPLPKAGGLRWIMV